jgi:hypothetical protein
MSDNDRSVDAILQKALDRVGGLAPPCGHPGCKVPAQPKLKPCSLQQPLMISIPAGGHVHLECEQHPDGHILYGEAITWQMG